MIGRWSMRKNYKYENQRNLKFRLAKHITDELDSGVS